MLEDVDFESEPTPCEQDEACALEDGHSGECVDLLGLVKLMRETVKASFGQLKEVVRRRQQNYL